MISQLTLLNFRCFDTGQFAFSTAVTCISGANGSGKTALLDAVYYLCYTKSYFTAQQQQIVRYGQDGFRLEGSMEGAKDRKERIAIKWQSGKKEISANGVFFERTAAYIGSYAAVIIAPDDLELINGGSEGRRRWIDSILAQTDKPYLEALLQYQRVLIQRNAWLKQENNSGGKSTAELDYYNRLLSESGHIMYALRYQFLDTFAPLLSEYHQALSGGKEQPSIQYQSDLHQQSVHVLLSQSLQNDLRLQRTSKGIHKDELLLNLNGNSVKTFGSQGQKKSFLFAMKLAQYRYLSKIMAAKPILLLDDVFEKLDQTRMEALLNIIKSEDFGQVILTDTHKDRVQLAFGEEKDLQFISLG